MRICMGLFAIVIGLYVGFYIGLWLCLVKGVEGFVGCLGLHSWLGVLWGLLRICLSILMSWLSFYLTMVIGLTLLREDFLSRNDLRDFE